MDAQGEDITVEQTAEDYAAEVARWREVRGMSKRALALAMGFDPSYVSHVESGRHKPSEEFSRLADDALNAGKAIWRRWGDYEQAKARTRRPVMAPPAQRRPEQPYATGSALVVEHDAALLQYDGSSYRLTMRRRLRNTGDEPVTRYLIRISVDRYPGDPERSNAHYRAHPLTWEELDLTRHLSGRDDAMGGQARPRRLQGDLAAVRATTHGRYPLYPGECVWIEYAYTVGDNKWGNWFQRAVRLPTDTTRQCSSPSPPPSTLSSGAPRPP